MRLFIAIPLPEQQKQSINDQFEKWKQEGVSGRFTPVSNLHLTLAFLGEIDPAKLDSLRSILSSLPFPSIRLEGLLPGWFGPLFYGGFLPNPTLHQYVENLRKALSKAGFHLDPKPFHPHLTLIRKASFPKGVSTQLPQFILQANRVVLYESDLGGPTPVYKPLWQTKS